MPRFRVFYETRGKDTAPAKGSTVVEAKDADAAREQVRRAMGQMIILKTKLAKD